MMGFVCVFLASDEWKLSSSADANGNAQPSPLAAKGYRSVHPSLSADKPQVGVCTQMGWRLVGSPNLCLPAGLGSSVQTLILSGIAF